MTAAPPAAPGWRARLPGATRLFLLSAVLLTAVGLVGQGLDWVLITAPLGPTAYLILAHPGTAAARSRSAVVGHACAIAWSLACLAGFGLWDQLPASRTGHDTPRQIGAQAVAVGGTLFLLAVCNSHHSPAAATALLVSSGIASPGPLLYGLLVGLALVLAGAPLLARVPPFRRDPAVAQGDRGGDGGDRGGGDTPGDAARRPGS